MQLKDWLATERGRATQLARHLKVPASFISKMAASEKPVPLDHCPYIQAFTDGQVTCEELRPDAVAYFALIRAQAANDAAATVAAEPGLPPVALVDRRDPTRVSPFAGTEYDRRVRTGEGA